MKNFFLSTFILIVCSMFISCEDATKPEQALIYVNYGDKPLAAGDTMKLAIKVLDDSV